MTDNDRHYGPFTFARWTKRIALEIYSGDDEDPECFVRVMAFGWAIRCRIPQWLIRPSKVKRIAKSWDEETIARLGRNWYYGVFPRQYGISLSDLGNGYDFLQVKYGAQTHDSNSDKSWCMHLPWKQWRCVRWSIYKPDGTLFATKPKGGYFEFARKKDECPKSYFGFEDHDGEMIVATCMIEEREWHKGEGWFKWMRWFSRPRIHRCLDLWFSAEVGTGKGTWKGGTIGHSIEMKNDETPQSAFERYCAKEFKHRQGTYRLRFIGPCSPPVAKQTAEILNP